MNKNTVLPDILLNNACKHIDNISDWEKRRQEIKDILSREEYGFFPTKVSSRVEVKEVLTEQFAGKVTREELLFNLENNGKTFSFPAKLIYPGSIRGKIPFFVFENFDSEIPNKYFPVEEITDRGVGVLYIYYNDVSKDENCFGNGIEKLFSDGAERSDESFGKLDLWAYAMSLGLDYLLTRGEADENNICAIGHSRLGKTALLAAAFDERFKYAFSNCSGCSGAALSRGTIGETVDDICRFSCWFAKNYYKYRNREEAMPFDQHFLLALICPRYIIVSAAEKDVWADSYNQFLACREASRVYDIYGKKGLDTSDERQILHKSYNGGNICYRERTGTHFFSREDWKLAIDFVTEKSGYKF